MNVVSTYTRNVIKTEIKEISEGYIVLSRDIIKPDFGISDEDATHEGLNVWGIEGRRIDPKVDLDGTKLREPTELPPESGKYRAYSCGLDIGARHDRTAMCVLEIRWKADKPYLLLVWMKRMKLGILYGDVAKQVKNAIANLRIKAGAKGAKVDLSLLVDASGIGEGVSEMIVEALPNEEVHSCLITSGQSATVEESGRVRVSKTVLVSNLVALFESHRIFIPKRTKEIDSLIEELQNFNVKVNEDTGSEAYGARTGKYDDQVMCLALAAWWATRPESRPMRVW